MKRTPAKVHNFAKDLRPSFRAAIDQGWSITLTNDGHSQWRSPSGKSVAIPRNLNSNRSLANWKSALVRSGLILDNRKVANRKASSMIDSRASASIHDIFQNEDQRTNERSIPNPCATMSIPNIVVDITRSNKSTTFSVDDLLGRVQVHRPDAKPATVKLACERLVSKGTLTYDGDNFKWNNGPVPIFRSAPKKNNIKTVEPTPPTPPASAPVVEEPVVAAGVRTGDSDIDSDLASLENALTAFANIDTIVRKYRKLLVETAGLKKQLQETLDRLKSIGA